MIRTLLSFVLVCLCVGAAVGAHAQAKAAAPDGDEYHRVIEEALQEFNLGNWDEAALLFERAHAINPSARTERGMGMAAFEARHYVTAMAHLSAALREQRNPLTVAQRDEVQRALARAQDYVARIAIDMEPSAARVRINGQLVEPDTYGDRLADPGVQEIEVAAEGFEPQLRRVHVAPGKRATLVVKLQALTSASANNPDALRFGPNLAATPSRTDTGALTTWKWVLGAAGVVGVAAGATFLIMQKVEADRFNSMCDRDMLSERCAALERSAGQTWYVGSIIGLGLGVGLLTTGTVMFILDGAQPNSQHAQTHGCRFGFADIRVSCKLAL